MLAPFLLFFMGMYVISRVIIILFASGWLMPGVNMIYLTVAIWILPFVILRFGFGKGLPRWFIPYLGVLLPIVNIKIYEGWIVPNWSGFPSLYEWMGNSPALSHLSGFLMKFIYQGTYWIGLFALLSLIVIVTRLVPVFRPSYQRFQDDWTLLSFLAYGAVPLVVLFSFGDYEMDFPDQGPYLLLMFMIVAGCGWFYLRSEIPWKRILSLFVGMALAMAIAEVARSILYEIPRGVQLAWQARVFQLPWQTKLQDITMIWIWSALLLLFPVLIKRLPGKSDPSKVSLQEGQ